MMLIYVFIAESLGERVKKLKKQNAPAEDFCPKNKEGVVKRLKRLISICDKNIRLTE